MHDPIPGPPNKRLTRRRKARGRRSAGLVLGLSLFMLLPAAAGAQTFLENGGGISPTPDIVIGNERRPFLADGGSVSNEPRIVIDGRRSREFLADGGGIYREPDILVEPRRRWRVVEAPRYRALSSGSVTRLEPLPVHRLEESAAGVIVSRPRPDPRIIDVATERLDRRPMPVSGIEVIDRGGPKIIRIASNYDRSRETASLIVDRRPSEGRDLSRRVKPGEPWSPQWLSRCSARYESFDPQFGTYLDSRGVLRFCELGRL